MTFSFRTPGFTRPVRASLPVPAPPAAEYEVEGKRATLNEYNVAQVFYRRGWNFVFQAEYFGGRRVLGGIVLDFLVYTPIYYPVEVFGNYWHIGEMGSDDRYRLNIIEQHFRKPVVVLWGNETETIEQANAAIRREIG